MTRAMVFAVAMVTAVGWADRAGAAVIDLPGGRLEVFIEDEAFRLRTDVLMGWIERSAAVVAHYYGRFPVAEAYLAVRGRRGRGVMHGRAFGYPKAVVNIDVGLDTRREDLDRDWVLIHELVHLAFPDVPAQHDWIEEGLAVYVESIARAQNGTLDPQLMWRGFLDGMPKGLPARGDRGLDHTPTWGRTYWGGALYCLLADLDIRRRTGNDKSLRDGLRAIVSAGHNITGRSALRPVLALADRATGVPVMTELYDRMRAQPYPVDLDSLWRRLGVQRGTDGLRLLEDAPLAELREALTVRDLGHPRADSRRR